jgi:transposase InsO family protein
MLGVPNKIRTDNGTGYYSQAFELFCQQFNASHVTGIFYNSQRQSIVKL